MLLVAGAKEDVCADAAVELGHALAPVEFLAGVRPLVRHEHERWGTAPATPTGLAGEAIPLGSRIILACDALHAETSERPHRRALPLDAAIAEQRRHAGTQYDPAWSTRC